MKWRRPNPRGEGSVLHAYRASGGRRPSPPHHSDRENALHLFKRIHAPPVRLAPASLSRFTSVAAERCEEGGGPGNASEGGVHEGLCAGDTLICGNTLEMQRWGNLPHRWAASVAASHLAEGGRVIVVNTPAASGLSRGEILRQSESMRRGKNSNEGGDEGESDKHGSSSLLDVYSLSSWDDLRSVCRTVDLTEKGKLRVPLVVVPLNSFYLEGVERFTAHPVCLVEEFASLQSRLKCALIFLEQITSPTPSYARSLRKRWRGSHTARPGVEEGGEGETKCPSPYNLYGSESTALPPASSVLHCFRSLVRPPRGEGVRGRTGTIDHQCGSDHKRYMQGVHGQRVWYVLLCSASGEGESVPPALMGSQPCAVPPASLYAVRAYGMAMELVWTEGGGSERAAKKGCDGCHLVLPDAESHEEKVVEELNGSATSAQDDRNAPHSGWRRGVSRHSREGCSFHCTRSALIRLL